MTSSRVFHSAVIPTLLFLLSPSALCEPGIQDKPGRSFMLEGQHEAASRLRLNDDGSYAFWFAAGGLDEIDHGTWRAEPDGIHLHSAYAGGTPVAELIAQSREANDSATVIIETMPATQGVNDFTDVSIHTADEHIRLQQQDRKTYSVKRAVSGRSIEIRSISMFDPQPVHTVPITDPQANKFIVRIDAGKFNSPRFSSLKLALAGDKLSVKMSGGYEVQYRLVPSAR